MTAPLVAAGIVYVVASALLVAYGFNLVYFSVVAWRAGRQPTREPAPAGPPPRVTVQLPIYNELYVSERIIAAACRLDYPAALLQIQVLDDSTDETTALVAGAVRRARASGVDISHVRRAGRAGFKAGALAHGLATATGEFVAIFDADFVPEPDFLRRAVAHFDAPDVGFVQARWGHLNPGHSWLTRLQALAIDAHFMVEQHGRGLRGHWFNFNGTAGIWRRTAIEDAGGWTADTLTEDLDLSYRAHLRGWRGRYARDLVAPAELPAHMAGFRRQQHRWARGSLECAVKLLPAIWRADARLAIKAQATAHLLGYGVHLLLFVLTVIYPLVVALAGGHTRVDLLFGTAYFFGLASLAPAVFFATGQRQLGRPWWREAGRVAAITVIGSGLMLNSVRAALQIVLGRAGEFERTAKFGLAAGGPAKHWMRQRYQLGFDPIVLAEAALGSYALATAWFAFTTRTWGIMLYAAIFGAGLLAVAAATASQSIGVFRTRAAREAHVRRERARLAAAHAD